MTADQREIDGRNALAIQFTNVSVPDENRPATFQFQLFADGDVEVHYRAAPATEGDLFGLAGSALPGAAAGIEGPAGARGLAGLAGLGLEDVGLAFQRPE